MPSSIVKTAIKVSMLLFVITFSSCKKGGEPIKEKDVVLDGTYLASNSINFMNVQMFTKNGEVTDQNIIKNYLTGYVARIKLTNEFSTDLKTAPFRDGEFEIDFNNNLNAYIKTTLATTGKVDSVKFDVSDRSSSTFTLKATDFIKATYTSSNSRLDLLLLKANEIQPFTNCGAVDVNFGFGPVCDYRDEKPFVIKNGNIYKNYISFLITWQGQGVSSWSYAFTKATFNPNVISQLVANDTLLIQTKQLLYTKK
jgi:hypothetical protein